MTNSAKKPYHCAFLCLFIFFALSCRSVEPQFQSYRNTESDAVNYLCSVMDTSMSVKYIVKVMSRSSSRISYLSRGDEFIAQIGKQVDVDSLSNLIDTVEATAPVPITLYRTYNRFKLVRDYVPGKGYTAIVDKAFILNSDFTFVRILISNGSRGMECYVVLWNNGRKEMVSRPFIS